MFHVYLIIISSIYFMGCGWITLAELGTNIPYLGVGVKSGNSISLIRMFWTLHLQIEACNNYIIL